MAPFPRRCPRKRHWQIPVVRWHPAPPGRSRMPGAPRRALGPVAALPPSTTHCARRRSASRGFAGWTCHAGAAPAVGTPGGCPRSPAGTAAGPRGADAVEAGGAEHEAAQWILIADGHVEATVGLTGTALGQRTAIRRGAGQRGDAVLAPALAGLAVANTQRSPGLPIEQAVLGTEVQFWGVKLNSKRIGILQILPS